MKYSLSAIALALSLAGTAPLISAQTTYTPYQFITIAGSPSGGHADGTGSGALFFQPEGVAVDRSGNVFVADTSNDTIRELVPTTAGGATTWTSTTIAGTAPSRGNVDGVGAAARFYYPIGIAVDANEVVYVADSGNGSVREITPSVNAGATTWNVTTLASGFKSPAGVAVDTNGNVYTDDEDPPCAIHKITSGGVATVLAGQAGGPGYMDGAGSVALFNNPYQLAVDGAGNVFVADAKNRLVREVSPAGVVSTVAGVYGTPGSNDGPAATARLGEVAGLAIDSSGSIFLTAVFYAGVNYGETVRRITAGQITTLAGIPGINGNVDGAGSAVRFNTPAGIAVDTKGNVFVSDAGNSTIREGFPLPLHPPSPSRPVRPR